MSRPSRIARPTQPSRRWSPSKAARTPGTEEIREAAMLISGVRIRPVTSRPLAKTRLEGLSFGMRLNSRCTARAISVAFSASSSGSGNEPVARRLPSGSSLVSASQATARYNAPGVDVHETEQLGQPACRRALARPGGTVDRDHRTLLRNSCRGGGHEARALIIIAAPSRGPLTATRFSSIVPTVIRSAPFRP